MIKKPKKLEKVKLGFYPYTYVRTVVMRSLLFRREAYQKMLKMDFSEIAKFLQESRFLSLNSRKAGCLLSQT